MWMCCIKHLSGELVGSRMSLPPLVCNTPPPPDQCEDDKDPEDFDITYNLSQDDDEDGNGYDFQTYPNYGVYESTKTETLQESHWPPSLNSSFENTLTDSLNEKNKETDNITPILNVLSEKLTLDDVAVEDLNLEISQEHLNSQNNHLENSDKGNSNSDIISSEYSINSENKMTVETEIPGSDFVIEQNDGICKLNSISNSFPEANNEDLDLKSEELDRVDSLDDDFNDFNTNLDYKDGTVRDKEAPIEKVAEETSEVEAVNLECRVSTVDDFGDFDDFQFVSNSDNASSYVETIENPWVHDESPEGDFGEFKANFDDNIEDCNVNTTVITSNIQSVNQANKDMENTEDNADDFGDFDDFKSCSKQPNEVVPEQEVPHQVAVLDFQSLDSENQILDSINNILSSIFNEEITETETEFAGRLESVLNETWGHLVDTDVRQPYMLNWNNSMGQKSLLKALCIDSRNILFGPKWNYNMPKYAVTLSAAPLMPQKPVVAPVPQADNQQSQNKAAVKESDAWSDPFSSNGQEFTYAEALLLDLEHLMATLDQMAHKHTSLKISELLSHACSNENDTPMVVAKPNAVEVFKKVIPPKMDKPYSPALNVQPLRQINLPDTHIFTPSDSETPRSKTIHYDNCPPVMLAQAAASNDNNEPIISPQTQATEVTNAESDEYWEFQDFKSTTLPVKSVTNTGFVEPSSEFAIETEKEIDIKSSVTHNQPHLLQPIKAEAIVPTLNWPDPGEVKDSFDDFSEFVSGAPWENAEKNVMAADTLPCTSSQALTEKLDKVNNVGNNITKSNVQVNNDEEFETFQSAPIVPLSNSMSSENSNSGATYQASTSKKIIIETSFSDFGKFSSAETITTGNDGIPKNNLSFLTNNHDVPSPKNGFGTNSPIRSIEHNILQPLPASSGTLPRVQNNTGQILHPLSLESYSQINWPNPGIDLQDLSRFNPVETLPSLKSESSAFSQSKVSSPSHSESTSSRNEVLDDDIWGDFVSSKPKQTNPATKKLPTFGDEDEWTEFVSSPTVKPQNGLNTISLNVHTNSSMQKSNNLNKLNTKTNQISLDIPTLNYITPKSSHKMYDDKHFQNL